jgi:hypothetical protein
VLAASSEAGGAHSLLLCFVCVHGAPRCTQRAPGCGGGNAHTSVCSPPPLRTPEYKSLRCSKNMAAARFYDGGRFSLLLY